jgi:hypothetical protein
MGMSSKRTGGQGENGIDQKVNLASRGNPWSLGLLIPYEQREILVMVLDGTYSQ